MPLSVASEDLVLNKDKFAKILEENTFSNYIYKLFDPSDRGSIDGAEWLDLIKSNLG